MGFQIAIDGPAGAGKSTIAKIVAGKLNFTYMDTGAMYRAMGIAFDENGILPDDTEAARELIDNTDISIRYEDGVQHIYLNGRDVSGEIRTEHAGNMASAVSRLEKVRERLVELQRELSKSMDVVMDGRDIGTVVLPDADLKIYMVADANVRARRREAQLREKGENPDIKQIEEDLKARDYQDMNRAVSPLKQADDAIYLDTSDMTIDEVASKIIDLKETAEKR